MLNSIKKFFGLTWGFIKKFPAVCYAVFSLTTYSIFSYDFFIIGLIPGYPFAWIIGKAARLFFPKDFFNVVESDLNSEHFFIIYAFAILISIIVDFLIYFIRTKIFPRLVTKVK